VKDDKTVHPKRVLFGLLLLNIFLGIIVFGVMPSGTIKIGDGFELQFLSVHDLFYPDSSRKVDVDTVLADITPIDTSVLVLDTLLGEEKFELASHRLVQYPDNTRSALASFFEALHKTSKDGELMRIVHYGDSQLEGDRISDYLRNKFQLRFGGMGPGIVQPIDVSRSRISIRQSESKDWIKYAIFGKTKRHPAGLYGIGCSSYSYAGEYLVKIGEDTTITEVTYAPGSMDSTINDSLQKRVDQGMALMAEDSSYMDTLITPIYKTETTVTSYLRYRVAKHSFPKVRQFEQVRMLYSSQEPFRMFVSADGESKSMALPSASLMAIGNVHSDTVKKQVILTFSGPSPLIYGIALDGKNGVAVDNFPMRGSSGTGYGMINKELLKKQYILTNTKLLILQYGINVIPNPQKNYGYYERMFAHELKVLKAANPDLSILVIGPSDMSRKRGGNYVSYPNVEQIRDAMKNAAFANGCAFWDLYSAMGGENSMVSWVRNEPPLANKDFTHFNSRGAAYVGEMIYSALVNDYQEYIRNKLNSPN
jgi:hypothetical protein